MNNDGGKFPDLSGAASLAIKLRTLAVSSKFSRVLEFPIVSVHLVLIFFYSEVSNCKIGTHVMD